jgi:uncharacterized protein (TIGR02597 family)
MIHAAGTNPAKRFIFEKNCRFLESILPCTCENQRRKSFLINKLFPEPFPAPNARKKMRKIHTKAFTSVHHSPMLPVAHANILSFQPMKHNLSLIVGAIALAVAAGSKAQTAVTDPVGYITCKVTAGNSLSFVSPTLVNKLEFSGVASGAAANVITLTGAAPLTAAAFNGVVVPAYDEANPMPGFYVEVSSGTGEGQWANIVSNTATTLTTDRSLASFITGGTTTVRIRKHATLNEIFGATNTAALQSGVESATADEVKVIKPGTHAIASYFFYDDGTDKGWLSVDNKVAGDVIILPDQGIIVQRKTGAGLSFVRVGHVKTGKTALYATPGLNLLASPRAVGDTFTLSNSNLANNGPITEHVLGGVESAVSDLIRVPQDNGSLKDFFYYNDGVDQGWVDVASQPADDVLNEGQSFLLLRKAGAGNLTWTAPAQPIAP